MADYDEFCIVAEELCVCVRKPELSIDESFNAQKCKTAPRYIKDGAPTELCFRTQQTSWKFTVQSWSPKTWNIHIRNIHKVHGHAMLAEIVRWNWDTDTNHQMVRKKFLFRGNELLYICFLSPIDYDVHFTIRLLEKRKSVDNLCCPLASDDAFAISVRGQHSFVVSACRLMQVSSYFRAMLTHETNERTSRKVNIEDADPEQFRALLEVIDPDQSVHPNPTNVVGVLKLADRYQVELAKDRCERHLINCVEIPLIERLQLAHTYRLNKLKESILSIGSVQLRALYNANVDELKKCRIGTELLEEMNLRLRENE